MPTLLFRNATALTMDTHRPRAQAVLIRDDRIAWVGRESEVPSQPVDRVIDCGGATLLPGLNDAHIHLLAYAASLGHVDCGRDVVASIQDIQRLVQARAQATAPGQWVRGTGYDEFYLKEGRHPTRADLDVAAPHHPVRLEHRSGHACVLNSRGLELVGVGANTPDPTEGVIERDEAGQPTGLLLEMGGFVSQGMRESRDPKQLRDSVAEASQTLLRWGVTSLQDASPENDMERWSTLRRMQGEGVVCQRLGVMPGIRHLQQFTDDGLLAGAGDAWLRLGPAKLVVTLTAGALHPAVEEVRDLVMDAHRKGFSVAVHVVEEEAITAVLGVLLGSGLRQGDRLEHCSEVTPPVQALLEESGITVVTQPGFLYESGERYATQVPQEMQPWLYPLRTLLGLSVPLAAGSDAPVASPDPWQGIHSAVTRRGASGLALHPEQGLSLEEALRLYTAGAAAASQEGHIKGRIQQGKLADLVLVDLDLGRVEPEDLLKVRVELTMVGGEVVWEE